MGLHEIAIWNAATGSSLGAGLETFGFQQQCHATSLNVRCIAGMKGASNALPRFSDWAVFLTCIFFLKNAVAGRPDWLSFGVW